MTNRPDGHLIGEQTTRSIIGAFYEVYNHLGPGYREHIYVLALERELIARGHRVEREVGVTVYYKGKPLARQKLDMVVDGIVAVESKAAKLLDDEATAQLFGYLGSTLLELGLVLHFGPKPRFYRVLYENRLKRSLARPSDAFSELPSEGPPI